MKLEIDIPDGVTIGDLTTVAGAMLKASTEFVDWDAMAEGETQSIGMPGRVLLAMATRLEKAAIS